MTQKNNVVDGRGHKFKIELAYFYSGRERIANECTMYQLRIGGVWMFDEMEPTLCYSNFYIIQLFLFIL